MEQFSLRLLLLTAIHPPLEKNMEDDLEAQLVQQLAEVWLLHAKKEWREREARLKVEREAKEKAVREARERAKQEAQEREHR